MSPVAAEVDELWSAVADPTRRRVLDVLLDRGEATATILAGELPVTRQAVAKHLAVLGRAGLVEGTRRGREVRYAIRPQRLDAATRSMALLAADWDARLSAIKRIAESVARAQATERQTQEGSDDEPQGRNARGVAGRP
jgi:ArsR family transcriptional regulator, cadmium/lead-responsive transcriptional repressor